MLLDRVSDLYFALSPHLVFTVRAPLFAACSTFDNILPIVVAGVHVGLRQTPNFCERIYNTFYFSSKLHEMLFFLPRVVTALLASIFVRVLDQLFSARICLRPRNYEPPQ